MTQDELIYKFLEKYLAEQEGHNFRAEDMLREFAEYQKIKRCAREGCDKELLNGKSKFCNDHKFQYLMDHSSRMGKNKKKHD